MRRDRNLPPGYGFLTRIRPALQSKYLEIKGFSQRKLTDLRSWVLFWLNTPENGGWPVSAILSPESEQTGQEK